MAENIGIVMSLYDKVSPTLKSIAGNTKAFDKTLEDLEKSSREYEKTQGALVSKSAELQKQMASANERVKEAQKAYRKLKDEASKGALDAAIDDQVRLKAQLGLTTKAIKESEKAYGSMLDQARKTAVSGSVSNQSEANGVSILGKGILASGLLKDFSSSVSGLAGAILTSAIGVPQAELVSQTIGGALSGAAAGAFLGVPGALAGAAIGGLSGAISGGTQIMKSKDDAFRAYVQDSYDMVTQEQAEILTSGIGIAARRETDAISFKTLFGNQGTADRYLADLVDMSNETPFLYDDLTAMSKTLATYGYGAEDILPVLQTIGDAGAALGQSTADMTTMATAIGRMQSSDKASLEYLNMLNDRGIGAVGMLADSKGVEQGEMYDMISKGEISGREAAEIILAAMTDSFSGAMLEQSGTFAGLSSTVEGLEQELENAMGEGFNQKRMEGLSAQKDWLSGDSGAAVEEAYEAIGAWKAELENSKEQFVRAAVDAMMETDDYKVANAAGDAAEMGRLIMQAKAQGMNEYNDSEGAQEALAAELALAEAIRDDASSDEAFYDAGYRKGQQFSRGLGAGIFNSKPGSGVVSEMEKIFGDSLSLDSAPSSNAFGLQRVPRDNFPALLHQGERVLTASEARQADRGSGSGSLVITGNSFTIRQESDIAAVARELMELERLERMAGRYER